jgi:hypothetical protein
MVPAAGLAKGTAMDRSKYRDDELLWEATGDPFAPYRTTVDGVSLEIQGLGEVVN